jgi:hypothetical protein
MALDEVNISNNQLKTCARDKGCVGEEVQPVRSAGGAQLNHLGTIKLGGEGNKLK